ncbi:MAG: hypothetical protein N3F66_08490 [Spirochaetes bacterium]|nr:hypothetical protein [Spirochaetota bacterium]
MNDYTKHLNRAIEERLQSSEWNEAIASAVIARIKRRNRIFTTVGAIAAIVIFVFGLMLWQFTAYDTNNSAYTLVHAQAAGVFAKVFPEAKSSDLTYSYIDDHVTYVIDTALLER